MPALVLVFSTVLIGALWLLAQRHAARLEFGDPGLRRQWVIASGLLFSAIVTCTLSLGASGALANFESVPPPMLLFMISVMALSFYLAFSRFGTLLVKHTPIHWLIAFHSFRLLAEIAIFGAVLDGIGPRALSFEGYNFDIVTAVTAVAVAWHAKEFFNPRLVFWWNVMGCGFLAVIFVVAMGSMPSPLRFILEEPGNEWVTRLPYVLLPGILVTAAITGHILIFRKLKLIKA
jgi:hypothetical protein